MRKNNNQVHQPSRRTPSLLKIALSIFIAINLYSLLDLSGAFTPWKSLKNPPAEVAKIIATNWEWPAFDWRIWVETRDGQIFTTVISYDDDELSPDEWKAVKDVPEIPADQSPWRTTTEGTDCGNLHGDIFPFNPNGQIIECIYGNFPLNESGFTAYLALMTDGTLKYWHLSDNTFLSFFFVVPISIVVSFIISLVILGSYHLIKYAVEGKRDAEWEDVAPE